MNNKILQIKVLKFIKLFYGKNKNLKNLVYDIYLNGNCAYFYLMLKTTFPCSKGYLIIDVKQLTAKEEIKKYGYSHIVTKIGERYYDISGEIKNIGVHCRKIKSCKINQIHKGFIRVHKLLDNFHLNKFLIPSTNLLSILHSNINAVTK